MSEFKGKRLEYDPELDFAAGFEGDPTPLIELGHEDSEAVLVEAVRRWNEFEAIQEQRDELLEKARQAERFMRQEADAAGLSEYVEAEKEYREQADDLLAAITKAEPRK